MKVQIAERTAWRSDLDRWRLSGWDKSVFITRLLIIPLMSDFRDSTQGNLIQSDERRILEINSNAIKCYYHQLEKFRPFSLYLLQCSYESVKHIVGSLKYSQSFWWCKSWYYVGENAAEVKIRDVEKYLINQKVLAFYLVWKFS